MNPIVTPVYHPSIPVLTAAGEEPVSVPPGYTEYVPTGAFQLTTTYNGTDPNSVIMMIAAGYFLGDAAGEGLGAMGGAGFRLFTKCADFTKAAEAAPTAEQLANLARFEKKLPANATPTKVFDLPNGGKAFQADSASKNIPSSFAQYEKQVDAAGNTLQYTKTTFGPNGEIIHVKDKIGGGTFP
jgi:hypothetical protein